MSVDTKQIHTQAKNLSFQSHKICDTRQSQTKPKKES